ncbi:hypothetical protein EDC04DRAFT_2185508 [Pisolithus marmoratus]|nr:hypothetical protein EDC04DRAFT_2185508 [Pisolithus marmoratus]
MLVLSVGTATMLWLFATIAPHGEDVPGVWTSVILKDTPWLAIKCDACTLRCCGPNLCLVFTRSTLKGVPLKIDWLLSHCTTCFGRRQGGTPKLPTPRSTSPNVWSRPPSHT